MERLQKGSNAEMRECAMCMWVSPWDPYNILCAVYTKLDVHSIWSDMIVFHKHLWKGSMGRTTICTQHIQYIFHGNVQQLQTWVARRWPDISLPFFLLVYTELYEEMGFKCDINPRAFHQTYIWYNIIRHSIKAKIKTKVNLGKEIRKGRNESLTQMLNIHFELIRNSEVLALNFLRSLGLAYMAYFNQASYLFQADSFHRWKLLYTFISRISSNVFCSAYGGVGPNQKKEPATKHGRCTFYWFGGLSWLKIVAATVLLLLQYPTH